MDTNGLRRQERGWTIEIVCDGKGCNSFGGSRARVAFGCNGVTLEQGCTALAAIGWTQQNDRDFCPHCSKARAD